MAAVGVGEQYRDQHLVGRQLLDDTGHAVQHVGQRGLAGDLLQQRHLLGREPLGLSDLGGLDADHAYAGHIAAGVEPGLVGEVEERLADVGA